MFHGSCEHQCVDMADCSTFADTLPVSPEICIGRSGFWEGSTATEIIPLHTCHCCSTLVYRVTRGWLVAPASCLCLCVLGQGGTEKNWNIHAYMCYTFLPHPVYLHGRCLVQGTAAPVVVLVAELTVGCTCIVVGRGRGAYDIYK